MKHSSNPGAGKVLKSLLSTLVILAFTAFVPQTGTIPGELEKAFTLAKGARQATELIIDTPGILKAEAEWEPQSAELGLILFGPGQMNYYVRKDGTSPQKLEYEITEHDLKEGNTWKISVVNMLTDKVTGKVRINYPTPPVGATIGK